MVSTKHKVNFPKNAAQGKRFGLVVSRYHEEIAKELLKGASDMLESLGAKEEDLLEVWVPGSFEIPFAAQLMVQSQRVDAVLCLGVIVKGETRHDEYIAREVANGISQVGRASGIPVIFGVLTTETLEQAKARAGGTQGHKGIEAAESAMAMLQVVDQIKNSGKKSTASVGFGLT